jgi:hypothetical protein
VYAAESDAVGDLAHLDTPAAVATIGGKGAKLAREILDRMRSEKPDEPFWRGVDRVDDDGSGVRVQFHPGEDPALRSSGGVEVACLLYPEGS